MRFRNKNSARLAAIACLCLQAALAQTPKVGRAAPASKASETAEDPLGRSNPHGCVVGFIRAANRGDYLQAAQYLEVPDPSQALTLARELKDVLDFGLSGGVTGLPRTANGDLQGGLPSNRQLVGSIKTDSGTLSVVLARVQGAGGGPVWFFSRETLAKIPQTYAEMERSNPVAYFPRFLTSMRIFGLPLWRVLGIILAVLIALALGFYLSRALMPSLGAVIQRMTGEHAEKRLRFLRFPISVIIIAIAVRITALFSVSLVAREIWTGISQLLGIAGTTWVVLQLSDFVLSLSSRHLRARHASDKIAVVVLFTRVFKISVVLIALTLLLHFAGVNVTAMLAGLGIGGIALALAAQKTLENVFGGISIIMRDIVRVGDFCKIAGQLGTVEDVGFASMRIRTLDRTVVSVSNAQVSQTSIENYTLRPSIWFHQLFGLHYATSSETVRQVLEEVNRLLHTDPRVENNGARIRLIQFGSSSLDLEVFAYILESDYALFLEIQEDLMLKIMKIVEKNDARLAMPSQTNYLERFSKPQRDEEHK